jgi:hypothetical protein
MHMSEAKVIIRPSLMVSLSTEVTGGVVYERKDLTERCGKNGKDAMGAPSTCKLLAAHSGKCDFSEMTKEEIRKWETTCITADKTEHDKAIQIRNKARSLITSITVSSKFGQLCPTEREADLMAAYEEAKRLAEDFNSGSTHTYIGVYMQVGVIPDNEQSSRNMSFNVVQLIDGMMRGLNNGNEEEVRKAANSLTELAAVLDVDSQGIAERAIAEARSAARAITKAKAKKATDIEKQKETVKKQAAAKQLKQARVALDMNADVMAKIEAASKKGG